MSFLKCSTTPLKDIPSESGSKKEIHNFKKCFGKHIYGILSVNYCGNLVRKLCDDKTHLHQNLFI